MQATLDATSLKRVSTHILLMIYTDIPSELTRALICLSRYGEDLIVYATPDTFALSTTNSSKSAYCRFKYGRQFFSRFKVDGQPFNEDVEEVPSVMGQLVAKVRSL